MDDAVTEITVANAVANNATMMMHGFVGNQGVPLVPLDAHNGEKIFDQTKLCEYMLKSFSSSTVADSTMIEADSVSMFAREMEKKCQISGGGSFPGASIAGSAVAELGVNKETQHRMHFSQMRQNAKFGTIALPGAFAHFDELQALVDESAMKAMLRATSPDVAKLAVDSFGPCYISSAVFGATLVITSKTNTTLESTTESVSAKLAMEFKAMVGGGGAASASMKMGRNQSSTQSRFEYEIYALGGDPNLILAGDEVAWRESGKQNPLIVSYTLAPIYSLLDPGSDQYRFLKDAVEVKMKEKSEIIADVDARMTHVFVPSIVLAEPEPEPEAEQNVDALPARAYLVNRWKESKGEGRSGLMLGFKLGLVGPEKRWCSAGYKKDYVPWEIIPVPTDHPGFGNGGRFYLVNRWKNEKGHSRAGKMLGFVGSKCVLEARWNPCSLDKDYVPFEFIPVPPTHPDSGQGRYYLVNRWNEATGSDRAGKLLGFARFQGCKLEERWSDAAHKTEYVPWEVIAVPPEHPDSK